MMLRFFLCGLNRYMKEKIISEEWEIEDLQKERSQNTYMKLHI